MTKIKDYKELKFTDDFMFCKVLSNNPDVCEKLAGLILGREVHIAVINRQQAIDVTADGHGIRLDVYFEDDESSIYDIEMQTRRKHNLPKRTRYYQGLNDLDHLDRGADYEKLNDTYIVFICTFDPFDYGSYRYTFEAACAEYPELKLNDGSHRIFVNSRYTGDVPADMRAFLDYINGRDPQSDLTKEIDALVDKARNHQEWRSEYMMISEKYRDFLEEGRQEGIKEGIKEGLLTAKKEMAVQMIRAGESDRKIMDYTGLNSKLLQELRAREKAEA